MLRGKFLSLILMVTTFLGVTLWSVWNYDRAFNAVTRYTQLSAWALAQLELEIHAFEEGLQLYRAGAASREEMNKRFDIAWNRLDVFLHGEEAKSVRARFGADKAVGKILALFERYEQDVVQGEPNSPALKMFTAALDDEMRGVRDVMVKNFTGPSASAQQARDVMFWLLGSLSGMQWSSLPTVAAAVFIMLAAVWILRSDLDLMLLGEGEAEYLGMNRKKLQLFIVILSSLIVAILVSKAGIIGFIGLITPHLARTAAGPSHGRLALFSALIGAIVMIWADVLSRALFAPEEVPIGVLTSIVGAPIFLWIVTHRYGEVQP